VDQPANVPIQTAAVLDLQRARPGWTLWKDSSSHSPGVPLHALVAKAFIMAVFYSNKNSFGIICLRRRGVFNSNEIFGSSGPVD
jgi:hypothetical protein